MSDQAHVLGSRSVEADGSNPTSQPCVMLIFGASGDLTKRLLVPAMYNLACDGLLSDNFAVLGTAASPLTTETFRENMSSADQGIRKFHTRSTFDTAIWDKLVNRFQYVSGGFDEIKTFKA